MEKEKCGYLLVTGNNIKTISLQQLTSLMIKIENKVSKS